MSIQTVPPVTLSFFGLPIVIEPSRAALTSDAGLLPLRQFDEQIGLTQAFAGALNDPRDSDLVIHTMAEMVRSRVFGILAAYEDQNDHDTLRTDPVFKIIADRSPDDPDLASQPTLSRFENAIDIPSLFRLRDILIDQFIASFVQSPRCLTFDLDAIDDPAHGHQQLTFWHGYYDQNQYLPLAITCADNDQFVMLSLRPGNVHAALGADDDLEYLVKRLRQEWPDVILIVRADAGFGNPTMYELCERLCLIYTFGLSSNAVLQRQTEELLGRAVQAWEQEQGAARAEERTSTPSRMFESFPYQAGTWPHARRVIAKAEANVQGTNRRFVVTNRPGAALYPEGTYDEYCARGESENRNKEFKCDLAMDRLSDHRFCANYFRLYLHAAAMNLVVRFRRAVALPVSQTRPPSSATEPERCRHFRERRQADPLGRGQPATWRSLFIKVAAEVVVTSRRIVVRLSSSWPHWELFASTCRRLTGHPLIEPEATG
jgi:hypothetical protein